MGNELLFCGIIGCVSALRLYKDYRNRYQFNNDFLKNRLVGKNQLFNGIICCNNPIVSQEPIASTINNLFLGNFRNNNIIAKYETKIKTTYSYLDYELPYPRYRTTIYWYLFDRNFYTSPNINFNSNKLILTDNSRIYYPQNKIYNIGHNKIITENSIPNNSQITIFASKTDTDAYQIDCMGPETQVLNDVAYQHYNIHDTKTLCFLGLLIASGLALLIGLIKLKNR